MAQVLKLAIWNANGLCKHLHEVRTFLQIHDIDVMLVSETHFTTKSHITIPKYTIYSTNHPDGKARGGTALIIKNNIKHHETEKYATERLQATSVNIEDKTGTITISAIYCPPKHINTKQHYEHFFQTLGNKFIAGGDYNAKHSSWGSRATNSKGKELAATIQAHNLRCISTGQPTYWPTDERRQPDLLDICITKGLNVNQMKIDSCLDLSSDHTPVIVTIYSQYIRRQKQPSLHSRNTNWDIFRHHLDHLITLNISLKSEIEIEKAVESLTKSIQTAAWLATPDRNIQHLEEPCPIIVKEKIAQKRKIRKQWQTSKTAEDKMRLNKITKELKNLLYKLKNQGIQEYLKNLSATEATEYSLWKATKRIRRPKQPIPPLMDSSGKWARDDKEKATAFANHLHIVFQPFQSQDPEKDKEIHEFLNAPFQMALPIPNFKLKEVQAVIMKEINHKKAPGFDLITGRVLKETSKRCQIAITQICNAVLRIGFFPHQWKVAQIVMLPKPGKPVHEITSYRPISLLPVLSKVFEKLLLKRLQPIVNRQKLIPDHQFGFRKKHSTIEQVNRIISTINSDFEEKRYCSAAFLDIRQAFDKVWHTGLLYKLKKHLPYPYYLILKSYLEGRHYFVKHQTEFTNLRNINSGVPQGSILGPMLYSLYTADLPTSRSTMTATFADDTVILASHTDATTASKNLQTGLNEIQNWLNTWRIKANEAKSSHVTFTLRRENCPPVTLNNCQLPQADDVKYLGMHLDRRLTWRKHITTKSKQLRLKFRQMYWLLGRRSQLSLDNKLLLYKTMIKPVWTYGIQLWGTSSNSNIEILQRLQNIVLRTIVNAPWYVPNYVIASDLKMTSVREEIKKYYTRHRNRLTVHPNDLAKKVLDDTVDTGRLKRNRQMNIQTRFP